jgi:hypothetical protein
LVEEALDAQPDLLECDWLAVVRVAVAERVKRLMPVLGRAW